MYWNDSDIRTELLNEWQQLQDSPYPEDLLDQFIDSALPVYYSDIIKDWQEMPNDFTDTWQDLTDGKGHSIFQLMSYDLWNYYSDRYHTIYNELLEEKETTNA